MKNLGNLYVNGGNLSPLAGTATVLLVAPGVFRDSTDVNDINLRPTITAANAALTGNPDRLVIDANAPSTTIFVNSNGVNGLDKGATANSTLYFVFAIGSSTAGDVGGFEFVPTACLLSLSATNPTLPIGYDMFRRIGTIKTGATAAPNINVLGFTQTGTTQSRTMWYDTPISVLAAGGAAAYTDVPLTIAVPPIATNVYFDMTYSPTAAGNLAVLSHLAAAAPPPAVGNVTISGTVAGVIQEEQVTCPCSLLGGNANVSYKNVGNLTLLVQGYVDQL
jgi:hypothetical protein